MAAIGQTRPRVTPNIRTPLFIFGVALALVAFLVMLAFGLLFANRAQVSTPVRVVVAARDIDAREPLTADMLTTTSLPSTPPPPKPSFRPVAVTGTSDRAHISKG